MGGRIQVLALGQMGHTWIRAASCCRVGSVPSVDFLGRRRLRRAGGARQHRRPNGGQSRRLPNSACSRGQQLPP